MQAARGVVARLTRKPEESRSTLVEHSTRIAHVPRSDDRGDVTAARKPIELSCKVRIWLKNVKKERIFIQVRISFATTGLQIKVLLNNSLAQQPSANKQKWHGNQGPN